MTPLPPVPNCLSITYKFTYGQDIDVISRIHATYAPATILQADINAYAQAQATQASATWASVMHSSVTLTLVTVVDLNSATGLTGTSTSTVPGTATGAELTASTCVLANMHVARRYRGGKPRMYLPWGVAANLQDPQHWLPAALTNFNAALQNLLNRVVTAQGSIAGLSLANVSYYQGSTAKIVGDDPKYQRGKTIPTRRPGGPQVDVIGSATVNARPGTQRRRLEFST